MLIAVKGRGRGGARGAEGQGEQGGKRINSSFRS